MDTWLPYGRMPRQGNHLASPGRLAGRQSSLHDDYRLTQQRFLFKGWASLCDRKKVSQGI